MKQAGQSETDNEQQWHARLSVLQKHPAPNLERGRARVLAAQLHFTGAEPPRRASLVLAFSVGLGVILMMVVMSSAMGALPIPRVALTRTETLKIQNDATIAAPGARPESPEAASGPFRFGTPVPGAVPEPPRSPAVLSTLALQP